MAEQSTRLARALVGVVVIGIGALLVIMGSSHFYDVSAFGITLPPEVPGLALLAVGIAVLMHSARDRQNQESGDQD